MSKITRSQFLKDMAKGWKTLGFSQGVFFDVIVHGKTPPTSACAIGAAYFGSTGKWDNVDDYIATIPSAMDGEIIKVNNLASDKAHAIGLVQDLVWPGEYAT